MTHKGYIHATREWLGENDIVVGSIEVRLHYGFYPGCGATYWQPGEEPTVDLDFVQIEHFRNSRPIWVRIERNQPASEPGGPDGEDWYSWAEEYLAANCDEAIQDAADEAERAAEYRAEARRDGSLWE